jgi:uncharacterized membrane protein YfcA
MSEYLYLFFIYAVAGLVHGVVGFGFALFSVPLVAGIYDPGVAVGMNVVVGLVNCASKAWLLRRYIEWKGVLTFFAASLLFVPLGVLAISKISKELALVIMGIFVMAVAVGNLRDREGMRTAMRTTGSFWSLSAISGLLSGAFAAPGPATVPYFMSRDSNPMVGKANLQLYFTVVAAPIVLFHGLAGNITPTALGRATFYVPIVFVLTFLGTRLSEGAPEKKLRLIVDVALIILGLWLLADNTLL